MAGTTSGTLNDNKHCVLWNHNNGATMNISQVWVDCEYVIGAVPGKTAYSVKMRARLACSWRMNYTALTCTLKVYCDGKLIGSTNNSTTISLVTGENGGVGSWSIWYTYEYPVSSQQSTIKMECVCDLSSITGINSNRPGGPDSNGHPGYHYHDAHCSGSVNVAGITIGKPPTLNYIINKKPYGDKQSISSEMRQIQFSWDGTWGDPAADSKVYYRLNGGTTINAGHVDPVTINDLNPGTTYKLEVYVKNSIGSTDWKSITIRTRYKPPEISLPSHTVDLECFTINWESTRPLKSLSYKISDVAASTDLCDWTAIAITSGDTSGTFETCIDGAWMDPKKQYTITFKGVSTDDYDYLDSNQPTLTDTTLDRSHITSIGSCIFGLSIDITITAESEKHHRLKIWTEGNDLTPTFTFDDLPKGVYTFTPTQDQLDQMYRSIPNTGNTVPIHFLLTTHGDHLDWDDEQQNQTLTLTGIAKTAHVGDENDRPRRCQVWIGDENDKPRRVVTWVGDANDTARRTI